MEKTSLTYLFSMRIEKHVLVNNRLPRFLTVFTVLLQAKLTEYQSKHLVTQHIYKIFKAEYNNLSFISI